MNQQSLSSREFSHSIRLSGRQIILGGQGQLAPCCAVHTLFPATPQGPMVVILTHCAGLEVHKKTVMACLIIPNPTGEHVDGIVEVQPYGTMTSDVWALADWLAKRMRSWTFKNNSVSNRQPCRRLLTTSRISSPSLICGSMGSIIPLMRVQIQRLPSSPHYIKGPRNRVHCG